MEIYEVFRRGGHKDPFSHAGTVTAPDPEMALIMAKECFLRRGEGERIWVVRRSDIHSFSDDTDLSVSADKSYRFAEGYREIVDKRERAKSRARSISSGPRHGEGVAS